MREWLRNVVIANEPRKVKIVSPAKGYGQVRRLRALPESTRIQSGSMLDVPCELALEKM
jgi:hypothetical protein